MDEEIADAVERAVLAFKESLAFAPVHDPHAWGMVEDCISKLERAGKEDPNLRGIDEELANRAVGLLSACARHSPRQGLRLVIELWRYLSRVFHRDDLPQQRQDGSSEARACAELYELLEMLEGMQEGHLCDPRPPEWPSTVFTDEHALARADRAFAQLHADGFVWAIQAYDPPSGVSFASARRLMDQGRQFAELSAGPYGTDIAARTWEDYRLRHDDARILKNELPALDAWGTCLDENMAYRIALVATRLLDEHADRSLAESMFPRGRSFAAHTSRDVRYAYRELQLALHRDSRARLLLSSPRDGTWPDRPTRRKSVTRLEIPAEGMNTLRACMEAGQENPELQQLAGAYRGGSIEARLAHAQRTDLSPGHYWVLHLLELSIVNRELLVNPSCPQELAKAIVQERGYKGRSAVPLWFNEKVVKHPELAQLILSEGRDVGLVAAVVATHGKVLTLGNLADLILRSMGMVIQEAVIVLDAVTALANEFPAEFVGLVDDARAECYGVRDEDREELARRLEAFKATPLAGSPARDSRLTPRAETDIYAWQDLETYLKLVQRVNAHKQAARLLGSGSGPIPWSEVETLAQQEKIGLEMLRAFAMLPGAPSGIIVAFAKKYGYPSDLRSNVENDNDPTQNPTASLRWLRQLVATTEPHEGRISEARGRLATDVLTDPLLRSEIENLKFPERSAAAFGVAVSMLCAREVDTESLDAIKRWIDLGWVERLDVAVSSPRPAGMMLYGLEYGEVRSAPVGANHRLPPPMARWWHMELGQGTDETARTTALRLFRESGVSLRQIVERARYETAERIEEAEDDELDEWS